ncbi:MAG: hypothetical protein JSS62_01420, partial [Verrucomicrobia bacterium]|nr:hypothetical protein [Verrucomicrobiota bacterium]
RFQKNSNDWSTTEAYLERMQQLAAFSGSFTTFGLATEKFASMKLSSYLFQSISSEKASSNKMIVIKKDAEGNLSCTEELTQAEALVIARQLRKQLKYKVATLS